MSERAEKTLELFTEYSETQKLEKGNRLAQLHHEVRELKARKKAEASVINEQIKDVEGVIADVSEKLRDGGENQFIKCTVDYNFPVDGKKVITRQDNYEQWEEDMTDADYALFRTEPEEQPNEEVDPFEVDGDDEPDAIDDDEDDEIVSSDDLNSAIEEAEEVIDEDDPVNNL